MIDPYDKIKAESIIDSFKKLKTEEDIFYHFCFAILVPQTTHKNTMSVVKELKEKNFFNEDIREADLKKIVKSTRFFNNKTRYLLILKQNWNWIYEITIALYDRDVLREFLVTEVHGLGMKAASHLMRNLGYEEVAIIDTHILKHYGFNQPKSAKEYIKLEALIEVDAARHDMSVGALDAYLWKTYSNTSWEDFIY